VAPVHAATARATNDDELFQEIAKRDIVVQHPYDAFSDEREAFVRRLPATLHVVT